MKGEEEDEDMAVRDSSSPSKRPKRQIPRNTSSENGLLWREEKELKKALYASLQESNRVRPSARISQADSAPTTQEKQDQQNQPDTEQTAPKKFVKY